MAKIVLGLGTSHTPMLLASDETLTRFVETDQLIRHHDKEGRPVTSGELLEKADPRMAGMVAPSYLVERQNRARAASRQLRQVLCAAALDALIIFGDDQNESYLEDCRPAFAIYFGATIRNDTKQHQTYSHLPEWYIKNRAAFFEQDAPRDYPVHAELAQHMIDYLMDAEFDLAASKRLRAGEGEGHAVAYVHRHVMDPMKPVPVVPVFLNTYYPPSQPRPRRCYRLGQVVRLAVESFPGGARVGVIASGGLSHFSWLMRTLTG
jgi:Catalytic LigB subunit of aromatic ring-opening dioxygenase